jgi:hypothetical protein
MNGIRCAIRLHIGKGTCGMPTFIRYRKSCMFKLNTTHVPQNARIFGSHSEAKRELAKWLPEWPDARIVDEVEL